MPNDLTCDELDRLAALAEAATKGEWTITENTANGKDEAWCEWHRVGPFELMGEKADDNDHYIAAANPETILRLVAMARRGMEAK